MARPNDVPNEECVTVKNLDSSVRLTMNTSQETLLTTAYVRPPQRRVGGQTYLSRVRITHTHTQNQIRSYAFHAYMYKGFAPNTSWCL